MAKDPLARIRELSSRIEALRGEMLKLEVERSVLESELSPRAYVPTDRPLMYPNGFPARRSPRASGPRPAGTGKVRALRPSISQAFEDALAMDLDSLEREVQA